MLPNAKNFCGGNFQDWLEVMLTEKCNGRCSWCVEQNGYHPGEHVSCEDLVEAALKTGKKNIILLGGEPTLYPSLQRLIGLLCQADINVYITTNGGLLTPEYVKENLDGITGINISIHHYYLAKNQDITGIDLGVGTFTYIVPGRLCDVISTLHDQGATVRLNCNIIKGYIDSEKEIHKYIAFAKFVGADSIRFAELKQDEENFVDLMEIFDGRYGINNEPFGLGCNSDVEIFGMPVNFRQMCGLQTSKRPTPIEPEQAQKQVLYYDGVVYDGWQVVKEEIVTDPELVAILQKVADGKITAAEAALAIGKEIGKTETVITHEGGRGCSY